VSSFSAPNLQWSDFSPAIQKAVSKSPWPEPTPVQTLFLSTVMERGENRIQCQAPTGTGKTAAYALGLLGKKALILCPSRELAVQVSDVMQQLSHKQVVTICAGRTTPEFTGFDVCVATPGRLVNVLEQACINDEQLLTLSAEEIQRKIESREHSSILENIDCLVVDEADRMCSAAFEEDMRALMEYVPNGCDKWLFSATFPAQSEPRIQQLFGKQPFRRLACQVDENEEEVSKTLSKKIVEKKSIMVSQVDANDVAFRTIRLDKRDRTQVLRKLLETEDWDQVVVFCATRHSTEHVARKLRRYGIRCVELHGKSDLREEKLRDFVDGDVRVLLTTDLISRGIDIQGLPAVVNYDIPRSPADFVHRIGRTARAGQPGTAITFLTAESEDHMNLIEKRYGLQTEREVMEGFEPDEVAWKEAAVLAKTAISASSASLALDKMNGGIKGRRKSKKDKLREKAAADALANS